MGIATLVQHRQHIGIAKLVTNNFPRHGNKESISSTIFCPSNFSAWMSFNPGQFNAVMLWQYIHLALHFIVCQLSEMCQHGEPHLLLLMLRHIQPRHPFILTSIQSKVPLWHASFTANMLGQYTQPRLLLFLSQLSQMCPHGKPRCLMVCFGSWFNHVDILFLCELSPTCPHGKPR